MDIDHIDRLTSDRPDIKTLTLRERRPSSNTCRVDLINTFDELALVGARASGLSSQRGRWPVAVTLCGRADSFVGHHRARLLIVLLKVVTGSSKSSVRGT